MTDPVFLDTSGLYAIFDGDDSTHPAVAEAWRTIVDSDASLHTSSYVLVELTALLQRRLGLAAVNALTTFVMPWVHVAWIDDRVHDQALAALLAAGKRDLSLVDCASFVLMRRLGIRRVLTVDKHFVGQGFTVVPKLS
jgi:predicted nucleic acid-binding protein